MRRLWYVLLTSALLLNCPKKYAPKVDTIEVYYLGSLYEDIYREPPLLSGTAAMEGIIIGYLETEPPILKHILGELGFFALLDEVPIDYIMSDTLVHNVHYLSLPSTLGYGIKNYGGIRFAIVRIGADSLTINDQVQLTLIKQRSDILWLIDDNFMKTTPRRIDFYVANRALADTSSAVLAVEPDSALLNSIALFRNRLDTLLSTIFVLGGQDFSDFVLTTIAEREGVNAIAYPSDLVMARLQSDTVTVLEALQSIDWTVRMHRVTDMTRKDLTQLVDDNGYALWGRVQKKNTCLVPNVQGQNLFDLFYSLGESK
jgi:hypothetical protein